MKNKLYVANINFKATTQDLEAFFGDFGEIRSVRLIYNQDSEFHRGFGFVEYSDEESANTALQELNGAEFQERFLKIDFARERQQDSRNSNRNSGDSYGNSRGYDQGDYRNNTGYNSHAQ